MKEQEKSKSRVEDTTKKSATRLGRVKSRVAVSGKTSVRKNQKCTEEMLKAQLARIPHLDDDALIKATKTEKFLSDEAYGRFIDRLNINADMKQLLRDLIKLSKKIGNVVVKAGKIVLNIILDAIHDYPRASHGLLIGLVLGLVVSSIPLFGWLIGPFVTPLFMLAGGFAGWVLDCIPLDMIQQVVSTLCGFLERY